MSNSSDPDRQSSGDFQKRKYPDEPPKGDGTQEESQTTTGRILVLFFSESASGKKPLDLDEWVAIIVALLTIGSIFAWSISPRPGGGRWPFASKEPLSPVDSLVTSGDVGDSSPTQLSPEGSAAVTAKTPADRKPVSLLPPAMTIPGVIPTSEEVDLPQTKKPQIPAPTDSIVEPETPPAQTDSTAEPPETPSDLAVRFKDVPDDFWAGPFITALVERDLLDGDADGNFNPNAPMTRAEYAVALPKAFKENPTRNQLNYQDVPRNSPAGDPIKRSTETGFLRGYPGEIFRPDQPMPRVQVIVSLANGLGLKAPSNPNQILQRYQDADRLPEYSLPAVAAATQAGLVVNYPNPSRLNPNQVATRAEVASLIHRALVLQGKLPEISSEYIVQPD
ncbi:MAG: S-layer homology domain-containing protein [Hormoscilla sp.]